MRFWIPTLLIAFMLVPTVTAAEADDVATVSQGNRAFAVDMYKKLAAEEGNIAFSPFSISTALAMTYAGASGKTAKEMQQTLHFADVDAFHETFGRLAATIGKTPGVTLDVANRLWAAHDFEMKKGFAKTTADAYGAPVEQLDFSKPAAAALAINTWVEGQTNAKIKDLLTPEAVDDARLVLTNAVYFKGTWKSEFEESATKDATFYAPSGEKTARLMAQTTTFGYANTGKVALLSLPYEGEGASMVIVLPAERDGLPALEQDLTVEQLDDWMGQLRDQKVQAMLPRFKVESAFSLAEQLKALGMKRAFTGKAEFGGMANEPLLISAVIHKAFVEVNEEGTEAAAATAVVMGRGRSVAMEPPVFRADHPFLYIIRDTATGSILFMGRVLAP